MHRETTRRKRDDAPEKSILTLHASKRRRQETTISEASCSIISGHALHNKPDAQLLACLFECYRVFRVATSQHFVDRAFIEELLSPRYLKSSLSGVQQMTGCLLSDIVRLSCGADLVEKTAAALPFDARHADDVLVCLTAPFEQVCCGGILLKACEQIIERASASRIFFYLIPHCRQPVQERLTFLFESVGHASGGSAAVDGDAGGMITTVTAAEMGKILVDVLNATRSIAPEQLAPLLKEVTAVSPTLLRQMETSRASGAGHMSVLNATQKKSRLPGAVIAARVFFDQIDVIQAAIANYVAELVEHGAGQVAAANAAGGDVDTKRCGFRSIGRAMEILVALMELHVGLVAQLVPALFPYMQHVDADVRLLLLRGFFLAYSAHETAIETYRTAFIELLTRFNDPKPVLRIEMLQLAAVTIGTAARISASLAGRRVCDLLPHVELRLVDSHALVRRAAVVAYSDIVAASSSFVPSDRMEKTLGLRVADKNFKVRQAAVEQLCYIYQKLLYSWIPNVVMRCVNAEGGVLLLESTFEAMLPQPTKVATPEALLNDPRHSALSKRRSASASMAVFDFEKENATQERTYVEGFAKLCSHLCPWAFNRLTTLATKKAQLRLAIFRLFQLRAEVRTKDLKSVEGQEMINDIHRLLSFLQSMTHAEKGEWDALFRAKDDRVCKAFLSCCADGVLHYAAERELLIKTLKGRVEGPVIKFVQDTLSKQMMFPLEIEHVDELLARLGEIFCAACRDKHATVNTDVRCEVEGLLRALLVFGRTAPQFLSRCASSLVKFLEFFFQSNNLNLPTPWMILLLSCLTNMAEAASAIHGDDKGNEKGVAVCVVIETHKNGLFTILGRLCDCDHESLFPNASVKEVGAVCKQAARCFMALINVGGSGDSKALAQLVETIVARVRGVTTDPVSRRVFGWLKTLTAFAKDRLAAPLLHDESLLSFITTQVLLNAVQDRTEPLDLERVKAKSVGELHMSLAGAVVDAAAKCLTAIAMSYFTESVQGAVSLTLNSLFAAYKAASEGDAHTVGACRHRLSINQQLAKLVVKPSADIGKELAVAVILSAEDEAAVRGPVQKKIAYSVLHNQCDMRYASLLILTAISEETKSGYQQLRTLVHQVGSHLRTKQRNSGATLSSPNALTCFLEYTIPFLVFFMAHHTFYSTEEENHFVAYQRVWYLLFDELFRHGTQCAGFVVELFGHIKQASDVLDAESHAARVLCDLGSRVMQECLGQRQISAEALKRYPGRVLLPTFFVRSKSTVDALNTVYLGAKIHIFPHVPFRVPTATVGKKAAADTVQEKPAEKSFYLTGDAFRENNDFIIDNSGASTGHSTHSLAL